MRVNKYYVDKLCSDCGQEIDDEMEEGSACTSCGHTLSENDLNLDYGDSLDYLVQSAINGQMQQCERLVARTGYTPSNLLNHLVNNGYSQESIIEVVNKVFP